MDFAKLREPFPATDIEWRIGRAGKTSKGIWAMCLAYITNRAIMERLDDVCGPQNWRNEYQPAPAGGVLCGLSIRISDEWVTKWDGAENTDMEAVKGGLSGAMKRAAVQWGIGRYLYDLPEGWATVSDDGRFYGKTPQKEGGDSFHWDPPALPGWALPGGDGKPNENDPVDRNTGEVSTPTKSTPKKAAQSQPRNDDMTACPVCSGPMYDNRVNKKNPKGPDLKCKSKECGHAIWLDGWRDDLLKEIAAAHDVEAIDAQERKRAEDAVGTLIPAKMDSVRKWLADLAQNAGA